MLTDKATIAPGAGVVTPSWRHGRCAAWLTSALVAVASATLTGCAQVDATADYRRAAALVSERTGAADVFDPHAEQIIAERRAALLVDGLTIDEAVQLALLNNRDLQAVFLEIGVSRADVVQSALLSNPTLALGFNFPEGGGLVDFTLGFAQQIAELWQIPVRRRIAENTLQRTIFTAGRAAVDLAGQVRGACFALLALRRAGELTEENVHLTEQVAQVAQRQFAAGQVSEFDVNLTRTALLDVRADAVTIQGQVEIAEATLANLLGLSRSTGTWRLTDSLPESPPALPQERELLERAAAQRLDARAAEAIVSAAEDEVVLQVRRVFPGLELGLAFERGERRALPGRKILADTARASVAAGQLTAPTIESRGQRGIARSQIINAKLGPSLALTLPIWDQNQAQIARAEFQLLQARAQHERLLDSIALDVTRAASTARASLGLIHLHRDQSIPLARATVEGATQLYQAGERDVIVLVEAQEVLVKRRRDWVNALRTYAIAMADLESAVGGSLVVQTPPPGTAAEARHAKP